MSPRKSKHSVYTPQKILVTGGAGFIGSAFVRQNAQRKTKIIVVDKLSYAGDLARLEEVEGSYTFYKVDICDRVKLERIFKKEKPDTVIHFAAETHVDRSIKDVAPFIQTNVIGTQNLIDLSRKSSVKKFIHISTDEVYGESRKGRFLETAEIKPNNPYAATKAAAEFLVRAAVRTHRFPAVIVRPANNYGPWQYPEKFIPVAICKLLKGQKVPVYGKGKQIREWVYVADCAKAIRLILQKGKIGEAYNIGGNYENNNLTTAKKILEILKKPLSCIQFVKDRPGHDFRYSVHYGKLSKLGWEPQVDFQKGIQLTAHWYLNNHRKWLNKKIT